MPPKQAPLKTERRPTLQIITRPNDANPGGDIFGGWMMSQADIAGAIEAIRVSKGTVATRIVKEFHFLHPLYVSDVVSIYADVTAVGETSITVHVEAYVERPLQAPENLLKVAQAEIVYVATSAPGVKRKIA